jgi:hypothetical protein
MSPIYFQDKYASNQEEDILKEINDINRQLQKGKDKNFSKSTNNNNSLNQCKFNKNAEIGLSFSHDCDELFPNEIKQPNANYYTF